MAIPGHRLAPSARWSVPAIWCGHAFELLGTPGQFYFDRAAHVIYYVPLTGEDLAKADVEAPLVQTLVSGNGTAEAPIHDVAFNGIQFAYAARPATLWSSKPTTGNRAIPIPRRRMWWSAAIA